MLILDTNVISAARRPDRGAAVSTWLKTRNDEELFLSVITIGEISRGIRQQEKRNPEFAKDLNKWLSRTELLFEDRIVPFSATDAKIWGELSAEIGNSGADLMIAASALTHDATVVTGNIKDFEPTGVKLIDPFQP